ncbi:cAMP-dependent protein kinase regulatory subunit [Diplonema papillatum]|nr:cAMP-dependent protein kinase regulatory subunit [Diplonema papillatum]
MAELVVSGLRRPRRRRRLASLGADGFDAACEGPVLAGGTPALKYLVRHAPMDPPCMTPPESADASADHPYTALASRMPLLSACAPRVAEKAARLLLSCPSMRTAVAFPAGRVLVPRGSGGGMLLLIVRGTALRHGPQPGGGEHPGEKIEAGGSVNAPELFFNTPRTQSVVAVTAVDAVQLSRKAFERLFDGSPDPDIHDARAAMRRVAETNLKQTLAGVLQKHELFDPIFRANDPSQTALRQQCASDDAPRMSLMDEILGAFTPRHYERNTVISVDEGMFFVMRGSVQVQRRNTRGTSSEVIEEGGLFPPLSLLYNLPGVTATAKSSAELLLLPRTAFAKAVAAAPQLLCSFDAAYRSTVLQTALDDIPFLPLTVGSTLSAVAVLKRRLTDSLQRVVYPGPAVVYSGIPDPAGGGGKPEPGELRDAAIFVARGALNLLAADGTTARRAPDGTWVQALSLAHPSPCGRIETEAGGADLYYLTAASFRGVLAGVSSGRLHAAAPRGGAARAALESLVLADAKKMHAAFIASQCLAADEGFKGVDCAELAAIVPWLRREVHSAGDVLVPAVRVGGVDARGCCGGAAAAEGEEEGEGEGEEGAGEGLVVVLEGVISVRDVAPGAEPGDGWSAEASGSRRHVGTIWGGTRLLNDVPRLSELLCETHAVVYRLPRLVFRRSVLPLLSDTAQNTIRETAQDHQYGVIARLLRKVSAFEQADAADPGFCDKAARAMLRVPVRSGELVVSEGSQESCHFYVVGRGTLSVEENGVLGEPLCESACFGLLGLFCPVPRICRVSAETAAVLFVLRPRAVRALRKIAPEGVRAVERVAEAEFTAFVLRRFVRGVSLFAGAGDDFCDDVVAALRKEHHPEAAVVAAAGRDVRALFFVAQGKLSVANAKRAERVNKVYDGQFFGERTLLYDIPRVLALTTEAESFLYVLTRAQYLAVAARHPVAAASVRALAGRQFEDETLVSFASSLFLLPAAPPSLVAAVARRFSRVSFRRGTALVPVDSPSLPTDPAQLVSRRNIVEEAYFIVRGQLTLVNTGSELPSGEGEMMPDREILSYTDGDWLNEVGLEFDVPLKGSLTCMTDTEVCVLRRSDFEDALRGHKGAEKTVKDEAWAVLQATCISAALRSLSIFTFFGDDTATADFIADAAKRVSIRKYRKGDVLVDPSVGNDSLVYVMRGCVSVTPAYAHKELQYADDETLETFFLHPGACYGEVALVCDTPRDLILDAATDTTAFVLERSSFQAVLCAHPALAEVVCYTAKLRLFQNVLGPCLLKSFLFSRSKSPDFLNETSEHLEQRTFATGEVLLAENSDPTTELGFCLIVRGRVAIHKTHRPSSCSQAWTGPRRLEKVAEFRDGECFNEVSLLKDPPRTLQITAEEGGVLYTLSKRSYADVKQQHPEESHRLPAVAEQYYRTEAMKAVVRDSCLFDEVRDRNDAELDRLVEDLALELKEETFERHAVIFGGGDGLGRVMYFIAVGEVVLSDSDKWNNLSDDDTDDEDPRSAESADGGGQTLSDGQAFGNFFLHFDVPRTLVARAVSASNVYSITQQQFVSIAQRYPTIFPALHHQAHSLFKATVLLRLLRSIPLLFDFTPAALSELAGKLSLVQFFPGTLVTTECTPAAKSMCFITRGKLVATQRGTVVRHYSDGESYGEIGLVYDSAAVCTIRAVEPTSVFLLSRDDFGNVVRRHPELEKSVGVFARHRFLTSVLAQQLQDVDMLGGNSAFLHDLALRLETRTFAAGEPIAGRGTGANSRLFVVSKGEVVCTSKFAPAGIRLRERQYFGEVSLVYDTPRLWTLTAGHAFDQTQLLILSRESYQETRIAHPDGACDVKRRLLELLVDELVGQAQVFKVVGRVAFLKAVAAVLEERSYAAGDVLATATDEMYFISQGLVTITDPSTGHAVELQDGDVSHGINVFIEAPHHLTVEAVAPTLAYALTRTAFNTFIAPAYPEETALVVAEADRIYKTAILSSVVVKTPLFARFLPSSDFIADIVAALIVQPYEVDDYVVEAGEGGGEMYFISNGTLAVYSGSKLVETLSDSDHFGELELLFDVPRVVSIKVATPCMLCKLQQADFDVIMARHPEEAAVVKEIGEQSFQKGVLELMVRRLPLFARCKSEEMITEVTALLEKKFYEKGSTVIKEGEGGGEMYFISRGRFSVVVGGQVVFTLKDGSFFGEVALLYDTPRTATIVAACDSHLFSLGNSDFKMVMRRYPLEAAWTREIARSRFKAHVLQEMLKKVPIFSTCRNDTFLMKVVDSLIPRQYDEGETIVKEGEGGNEMYFMSRGALSIRVGGTVVHTMKDGGFFGEIAVMYDTPRTATIVAEMRSQLYMLTKADFSKLMLENESVATEIADIAAARFQMYVSEDFSKRVSFFKSASKEFMKALVQKLVPRSFEANQCVITEGSGGEEMFYVSRGELLVTVSGKAVHTMKDGDFFGEVALVYDTPRTATIKTAVVTNLLVLNKADFESVLASYPQEIDNITKIARSRLKQFVLGDIVKKVPMFSPSLGVSHEFILQLVDRLTPRKYAVGEFVIKEGSGGNEMFFVSRGHLSVHVGDQKVHSMRDGDFFGEVALVYDTPRTASISAATATLLFVLVKEDITPLMEQYPAVAESIRNVARDRFQAFIVHDLVCKVPLFASVTNDAFIQDIVKKLIPVSINEGDSVIEESSEGNEMYFISRGDLEVTANGKTINTLRDGDSFGEVGLVYATPRTASVVARSSGLVLQLNSDDFHNVAARYPALRTAITDLARTRLGTFVLHDLVKKVPFFRHGTAAFTKAIVDKLTPRSYPAEAVVIAEGSGGDEMFFVSRGTLSVTARGTEVGTLKDGDFFGEVALFYDTPRTAQITTCSRVQLFVLKKADFVSVTERHPSDTAVIKTIAHQRFQAFVLDSIIRKVPLFAKAEKPFVDALIAHLIPRRIKKGTVLMRAGDDAEEMYFIAQGHLGVHVGGHIVKELHDGDFVGEVGLVFDTPRTASIIAHTTGQLYVLTRNRFKKVLQEWPEQDAVVRSIASERYAALIVEVVRRNPLFERASVEFVEDIVRRSVCKTYEPGDAILLEGMGGDEMYFVTRGRLTVSAQGVEVAELRDGSFFGEVALLHDTPRIATISAASRSQVFALTRAAFADTLSAHPEEAEGISINARTRLERFVLDDIVRKVPMFQTCESDEFIREVVSALVPRSAAPGEVIITEGEGGDAMYFVSRGRLTVSIAGRTVFDLQDGDFFGEVALVYDTPRTATICADTETQLFVLAKEDFRRAAAGHPHEAAYLKSSARRRFEEGVLLDFLENVSLFKNCDKRFTEALVKHLVPKAFSAGETVIAEGEGGDEMYFVSRGVLRVISSNGEFVSRLKDGDHFGEVVLVFSTPRIATITAETDCLLLTLTREAYKKVVSSFPELKTTVERTARRRLGSFVMHSIVEKVPLFRTCREESFITDLVVGLEPRRYTAGSVVVEEGEAADEMYIVSRGELNLLVGGKPVALLTDGDFFGEVALLLDTPRTASVVAVSEEVHIFVLNKDTLEATMKAHPVDAERVVAKAKERFSSVVLLDFVGRVPMFRSVENPEFLTELVRHFAPKRFKPGEVVIREGDGGSAMFFVARGRLTMSTGGEAVRTAADGDFFGEVALVFATPRTATVTALEPTVVYILQKESLAGLADRFPAESALIQTVARKHLDDFVLHEVLTRVPLFERCLRNTAFLLDVVRCLEYISVLPQHQIITAGTESTSMYFVLRGEVSVIDDEDDPGTSTCVERISDGGCFGEVGLIYDICRRASVVAASQTSLLMLRREQFEKVVSRHPVVREEIEAIAQARLRSSVARGLQAKLPVLAGNDALLRAVCSHLVSKVFQQGSCIVQAGDPVAGLYIVTRGLVLVDGGPVEVFGGLALQTDGLQAVAVFAASKAEVLLLPRQQYAAVVEGFPGFAEACV